MEFARSPVARKVPEFSELMTPTGPCVSVGFFMLNFILIAVGGAAGGTSRFWLSGVIANCSGQSFPEI